MRRATRMLRSAVVVVAGVAAQAHSDGTWTSCSGTLISPTGLLTAAHCGEGGDGRVRMTFSTAYHDGDRTYTGTFTADPRYRQAQSDPHDVRSWCWTRPSPASRPPGCRPPGSRGHLLNGQTFTSVGYGAYQVVKAQSAGGHTYLYDDIRRGSTGTVNATTPMWLRISGIPRRATAAAATATRGPQLPRLVDDHGGDDDHR